MQLRQLGGSGGGSATPNSALNAAYAALPKVATTVTASGAAAVNKHNPVDATTGALAISLPTGQTEGTQISVEKVDTSTNLVNATGSIRGVGSSTLPLAWQYESIMFRADSAGSWWPIAGHKTKTSLDAAFVGKSTRRAMAVYGTPMLGSYFNNAEMTVRVSNTFPDTTTRWRLRLRNYKVLQDTAVATGASFLGMYAGQQALDSAGAPTGAFVSAPRNVLGAFTLPADGSEYTSAWVTATADQITGGVPWLISLGYTGGATTNGQASGQGQCWYKIGASSSAAYSQTDATGISTTSTQPFDIRIEYEVLTDKKVGLAIGDSITFGTASVSMPQQFSYPSVFSRMTRHHLINAGIPTVTLAQWATATTEWKWQRFDPSNIAYDFAVIAAGTNDVGAAVTLASMKTYFLNTVALCQSLGIKEIYGATLLPRNFSHGRLAKPAAAAATSIVCYEGGLTAGAVQIGDGLFAEARTTSGTPTDNGDGTFTYTITAGLTSAHKAGEIMALSLETVRIGYNSWLRGLPGGITGAVSFDRLAAAPYDRAVMWGEYAQTDGLHPTASLMADMARTLPPIR